MCSSDLGPGIHTLPRVEVHVHVRPGIQVQAAQVEPPPAYNRYELIGGPEAVREAHYIRLVRAANHILSFPRFSICRLKAYIFGRFPPESKNSLDSDRLSCYFISIKKHGKAG